MQKVHFRLACDEKEVPFCHLMNRQSDRDNLKQVDWLSVWFILLTEGWIVVSVVPRSHLKNWCLAEKKGDGEPEAIHFGFIRWIINCCAADKRFCKYDYWEEAISWNYGDEGSVSERLSGEVCSINVLPCFTWLH